MVDEAEDHTIRLLQELRGEMREIGTEIQDMRSDFNARFDDVTNRVDGITLLLTMLAGLVHKHEASIEARSEAVNVIRVSSAGTVA